MLQDENPQEIFESLNSTGLDLTKADLIQNFLFMPLKYDEQKTFYKNYWLAIENLLRPTDNVENFLIQYLVTKRRSDSVMGTKSNGSAREIFTTRSKNFSRTISTTSKPV